MIDFPLTDDVVLLNSGDTGRKGMYVEFGLFHHPDGPIKPGAANPFNELSQGREKGQRFRITVTPLADDETTLAGKPADERSAEPAQTPDEAERLKGGARAKRAGILCNDPAFQNWFHGCGDDDWTADEDRETVTARTLRFECGVDSRADLDHNQEAGQTFDEIVNDFYRSQRGETDELVREQMR